MGIDITTIIAEVAARKAAEVQHRNAALAAYNRFSRAQRLGWALERAMGSTPTPSARMLALASRYEAVCGAKAAAKAAEKAASDAAFDEYWQWRKAEKALAVAKKYASLKEAFAGSALSHDIHLLAEYLYPDQKILHIHKTGSDKAPDTAGLPEWYDDRESYETVRYGTVYYFRPSTLEVGTTVEYDGRIWEVLTNYYVRGSGASLAYQSIWLLEVAQNLPE